MYIVDSAGKTAKTHAVITGVFFIMATVFAIIGLKLYDPILLNTNYPVEGAEHSTQIVSGAIAELILACSAAGTAIMLFPYLKRFNESMGLGYVIFRILEVVFILIGIVSVLALLALSHSFTNATQEAAPYKTVGIALKAIHDWTFLLGPNFMLGINTFIYSYVFYRSGIVPRSLSILGIVGAILVFTVAILQMFDIVHQMSFLHLLLSMPVAFYEMILAVWLIVKGFSTKRMPVFK